jgi:hypothetical protein
VSEKKHHRKHDKTRRRKRRYDYCRPRTFAATGLWIVWSHARMLVDWIICNRWKFILPAGARQAKQAGSTATSNFPLEFRPNKCLVSTKRAFGIIPKALF